MWKFLKGKAANRWHPTFEAMQQALSDVLDHLEDYHDELATLMVDTFHIIEKGHSGAVSGSHLNPRKPAIAMSIGRAAASSPSEGGMDDCLSSRLIDYKKQVWTTRSP